MVWHPVVRNRPDDDPVVEHGVVDGAGAGPGLEGDEVAERRDPVEAQGVQAAFDLIQSFYVETAALGDVVRAPQSGLGGEEREAVGIERLPHAVHQIGELRRTDAVADAQGCKPVDLGEGPRDDQVRVGVEEPDGTRTAGQVLRVRLIDHDPDRWWHAREEIPDGGIVHPGSGGIVGVGDVDDPRGRVHCGGHGVEVVTPVHRTHAHHATIGAGDCQWIDDEAVFVHDTGRTRRHRHASGQVQDVVGAIAEGDLLRSDAMMFRQGRLETEAIAVRVAG